MTGRSARGLPRRLRYRDVVSETNALLRHFLAAMLADLGARLERGDALIGIEPAQLLQGPFSDAMTHAGQLALLRRLAGAPVPPEDFIEADVSSARLGPDQPAPRSPDAVWPEAPPGWTAPRTTPES